jgi:hypothetical protein
MSTYVAIKSACGRVTSSIDIFDLDLNPHGIICCPECETIIASREAWADFDEADYMEMYWGMDGNE